MSKRIIILSDGTGNSASKVWRTNVWRVFESLDLSTDEQVAFYDDGVGTSSFKPLAILGGAFGVGLKRNVIDLYKFVCRNYRSANDYKKIDEELRAAAGIESGKDETEFKDDDIYGFGFSRGAFTIRTVIGLIHDQGLVKYATEQELDTKAAAAYRAYRARNFHSVWGIEGLFRWVRNWFVSAEHEKTERPVKEIKFLGLWDTVAAYGLPVDEWTRGISKWIWPLELPGRQLSDKVKRACHAVCLDDARQTFQPVLWDEEKQTDPAGDEWRTTDQRITQVWFAGVHSNVGGGYPDDALAKVSLTWMMNEATVAGVKFKQPPRDGLNSVQQAASAEDKDGRLYDSRSGLGGYYRYGPRKVDDLRNMVLSNNPQDKVLIRLPKIHESVFGRINVGAHLYAPIGLPKEYAVVSDHGIVRRRSAGGAGETDNQRDERILGQENTWNLVWKRRVVYFLTVFASICLAIYPLYRLTYPEQELETSLRLVSDTVRLSGAFLPSSATRWLDAYARDPGWFLVSVASVAILILYGSSLGSQITDRMRGIWNRQSAAQSVTHIRSQSSAGGVSFASVASFLFIVLLVYVALYPIFARWKFNWALLPDGIHTNFVKYTAQPIYGLCVAYLLIYFVPESWVHWLRNLTAYKRLLRTIKLVLAPFLFAVLTAWYGLAFASHYLFDVRDGRGVFCAGSRDADYLTTCKNENVATCDSAKSLPAAAPAGLTCSAACKPKTITIDFSSSTSLLANQQLCHPTKILLERGGTYLISVKRSDPGDGWSFWNKTSHLYGQPIVELKKWQRVVMVLLYPFRRSFDRPWGSIIARFGSTGNEESFMDPDPVPKPDEDLGEPMRPKRDGELFFYLNEPVVGIWGMESFFANLIGNKGAAQITVTKTK
jgi:uncharacterized protein (DUF2235 family)